MKLVYHHPSAGLKQVDLGSLRSLYVIAMDDGSCTYAACGSPPSRYFVEVHKEHANVYLQCRRCAEICIWNGPGTVWEVGRDFLDLVEAWEVLKS